MLLRIDVASGGSSLATADIRLGGVIPYAIWRTYDSRNTRDGPLGPGWRLSLDVELELTADRVICRGGPADGIAFGAIGEGKEALQEDSGILLQHFPEAYVLMGGRRRQYVFRKAASQGGTIPLSLVRDAAGNTIRLERRGRLLTAVVDTEGRRLAFAHAGDRLGGVTLEAGGERRVLYTFAYTMRGELASATHPVDGTTSFSYDGGLLVQVDHPTGHRQYVQYDEDQQCVALWTDAGDVVFAAYDPLRLFTRVLDGVGHQTLFRRVIGRQVLERVLPEGSGQAYYYDEVERVIGYSNTDGSVARFQKHEVGDGRINIVEGQTSLAAILVDDSGQVVGLEDPAEYVWRLERDEHGLITGLTTPLEHQWQFARDRTGRVTALKSPEGRRAEVHWSRGQRRVEAGGQTVSSVSLGPAGEWVRHTDGAGRTWRATHDLAGRLTKVAGEGGYAIEFAYGADGELVLLADSERRRTRFARDACGRSTRIEIDGRLVDLSYDPCGRLVGCRGKVGEVSVEYDGFERIQSVQGPGSRRQTWLYEDDGSVQIDDGAAVRRYDDAGRLLVTERGGAREAITYGPVGEVVAYERVMDAQSRLVTFSYLGDGSLRSITALVDPVMTEIALEYDADGGLVAIAAERVSVAIARDARGRPEGINAPEASIGLVFDAAYRMTSVIHGDEHVDFEYDVLDRPLAAARRGNAPARVDLRFAADQPWERRSTLGPDLAMVVRASIHGIVLCLEGAGFVIPVHWGGDLRAPRLDPARATVLAALRGPDRTLAPPPVLAEERLAFWQGGLWQQEHCAVPDARSIGYLSHVLDADCLHSVNTEISHYPVGAELHADRFAYERCGNDLLTGFHVRAPLRPRPWASRDLGGLLGPLPLRVVNGRVDAEALARKMLGP